MKQPYSIAITGMGGIYPKALNPEELWQLVLDKRTAAEKVPASRWGLSADALYHPEKGMPDRVYSKLACLCDHEHALQYVLEHVDTLGKSGSVLDHATLKKLDPLFHVFFYTALQALQDAGLLDADRQKMGVIAGNLVLPTETTSRISWEHTGHAIEAKLLNKSVVESPETHPLNRFSASGPATLLSEFLGLGAGGYCLDAACASSLYAIKLACDLLSEHCVDYMLAGGVSRPDNLYTQMGFSQLRALSPDGVCSPFDAKGNGLVVGEGAGLFVLRRLDDALRDGDHVLGVIRGIGLSNDQGGRLLAPTSEGQLRAMRDAYEQAGWHPDTVDLIECHATGTPVGDAVEFESLKKLWRDSTTSVTRQFPCVIGSVKSNIGHMLTGAGAAAMTKVLLAMKYETLPPSANFQQAPADWEMPGSPFTVLDKAEPWSVVQGGEPRRAAVSAFGFGGINAHVLLEGPLTKTADKPETTVITDKNTRPLSDETLQEPIAVVAMDVHIGSCDNVEALSKLLFSSEAKPHGGASPSQSASEIDALKVSLDQFRIPPAEFNEMLPQQVLMLLLAIRAWKASGLPLEDNPRASALIGLGLDMNSTNFHVRWMMEKYAPEWAAQLDVSTSGEAYDDWLVNLRNAAGPHLTANRTMGALGSVVASRIARELHLGGPSFTFSSEDCSGLHALETGMRLLRNGDIDTAIVGAVDFTSDQRNQWAVNQFRHKDFPSAEGAVVIILKRLRDAETAGDPVLAVLEKVLTVNTTVNNGSSIVYSDDSAEDALKKTPELIAIEPGLSPASQGALVADILKSFPDCNHRTPRVALHISSGSLGYTGAVSGLTSLLAAIQSLHHCVIPSGHTTECIQDFTSENKQFFSVDKPQYWLHNRGEGPRKAAVVALGLLGKGLSVSVREGIPKKFSEEAIPQYRIPTEGIFVLQGDDVSSLLQELDALKQFIKETDQNCIHTHAKLWWHRCTREKNNEPDSQGCRAALVSRNTEELLDQLAYLRDALRHNPSEPLIESPDMLNRNSALRDRVFYNPRPLGREGKLAFVYPGSGNHYPDMGRALMLQWPELLERQERENMYLRSQYHSDVFWNAVPDTYDHNSLILGQVSLGSATTDLMALFGLCPKAVIGLSLGETAGLFSTRTWRDRDEMLRRIDNTNLFTIKLGGDCEAARKTWKLPRQEAVDWALGVIDRPMRVAKNALKNYKQVYPLIANTLQESVVGGNRKALERFITELKCHFIPIEGVTTVHCEVVKEVQEEYRALHLFEATPPEGVLFYSGAWGRSYPVTGEHAAEAILAQALEGVDFPRVIEQAYADGVRIFIEMGPGNSCTRMVQGILQNKPHLSRALCYPGQEELSPIYRTLACLIAEGLPVNLGILYNRDSTKTISIKGDDDSSRILSLPVHSPKQAILSMPPSKKLVMDKVSSQPIGVTESAHEAAVNKTPEPVQANNDHHFDQNVISQKEVELNDLTGATSMAVQTDLQLVVDAGAHRAFLEFSRQLAEAYTSHHNLQMALLGQATSQDISSAGDSFGEYTETSIAPTTSTLTADNSGLETPPRSLNRDECLMFAVGKIGDVLGKRYAEIDKHPTRVRLPDEPLMLVDRILEIEGEPCSLGSGRVVTEHDVLHDAWYLDNNRIPTCVAVEAGQADLFLSAYLGIDFETLGIAKYRLLDAEITFHRGLARPGEVIHYDIRIEKFFRHGNPWFFQFHYDSTINGEPFLTMRNGCAGFFTEEELDAGQGVVSSRMDKRLAAAANKSTVVPFVSMKQEQYTAEQLDALRDGDFVTCFGADFSLIGLQQPLTLPGGMMRLVHRVVALEPDGGNYNLGRIVAEADIQPDDWFITCHFVDDRVMPGTLMYECCFHTLRIYLYRMGWIGEKDTVSCDPVTGITSRLKCRGQVLESTKLVTYEVTIKELGYNPHAFAIADARMYADGKPVADITDMCMQLTGLHQEALETMWQARNESLPEKEHDADLAGMPSYACSKPAVYSYEQILAFSIGKPSLAFGDRYLPFDDSRVIARLPGPPYDFISRITDVVGEPWVLAANTEAEAQYDVSEDAWYFSENRQPLMPFAVLLEVALQPCGWLAAYMGSALTSDDDLKFRNLGGNATQHKAVTPASGMLTTRVRTTNVAHSGGMIIQHFDITVWDLEGPVYSGNTYFGFFTHAALSNQVGVRDAKLYVPPEESVANAVSFPFPSNAPFPGEKLRMLDEIPVCLLDWGPHGYGFVRGIKKVDPDEWFFKAHFYQDPVCPGSLGLESFLQLLKVYAAQRWRVIPETVWHAVALETPHEWIYRGQVIPQHELVTVEAIITDVDDVKHCLIADGFLLVDGRVIYQMKQFSLALDNTV